MAFWNKPKQVDKPRALVASAVALSPKQQKEIRKHEEPWQIELWDMYDQVGEFRFVCDWRAGMASMSEISMNTRGADGLMAPADDNDPRKQFLDEIITSCGGMSTFLHDFALPLVVVSQTYLLAQDVIGPFGNVTGYKWRFVHAFEIKDNGGERQVWNPESGEYETVGANSQMFRIWDKSPTDSAKASSPNRASLPILREIDHISRHIALANDSRIASNGMTLIPSEVSLSASTTLAPAPDDQPTSEIDQFMSTLWAGMQAQLADRDSPGALMPLPVQVPNDYIPNFGKHVTFETPFDAAVKDTRDAAIKRLAISQTVPPEIMLGMADVNHWSSWQRSEEAVRTGVSPTLDTMCNALQYQVLAVICEAAKDQGIVIPDNDFEIVHNDDRLIQRPNNGPQAITLRAAGLLNGKATLEANGFSEDDELKDDELKQWRAWEMVKQRLISDGLGAILGFDPSEMPEAVVTPPSAKAVPDEVLDTDTPAALNPAGTPDTQNTTPPTDQQSLMPGKSALAASAETLVDVALAAYGKRLKVKPANKASLEGVPDSDVYLSGPVDKDVTPLVTPAMFSALPIVASAQHVENPETFGKILVGFTEALIRDRRRFDTEARAELAGMVDHG